MIYIKAALLVIADRMIIWGDRSTDEPINYAGALALLQKLEVVKMVNR